MQNKIWVPLCAVLLLAGCVSVDVHAEKGEVGSRTVKSSEADETTAHSQKQPSASVATPKESKASKSPTPTRSLREPAGPGPGAGAPVPATEEHFAVFPVKRFVQVSNEDQVVSAPVPEWMGDGRVGHNRHQEFSVDGVQLILGSRPSLESDKELGLALREDMWMQEDPAEVTYKKVTSDGFVISGVENGNIFYEVYEIHDDHEFFGMWFYPESLKGQMDPVIVAFLKGFKAGHVDG